MTVELQGEKLSMSEMSTRLSIPLGSGLSVLNDFMNEDFVGIEQLQNTGITECFFFRSSPGSSGWPANKLRPLLLLDPRGSLFLARRRRGGDPKSHNLKSDDLHPRQLPCIVAVNVNC